MRSQGVDLCNAMGDDDSEKPVVRQSRNVSETSGVDPVVQMELVYDKLCLLDYREKWYKKRDHKNFHKWCFGMPAANPSLQFHMFLDLCAWLMSEISGDEHFYQVDKFDDPNTAVNKLMLALRKLDFGLDYPSSKLKQAYGDATVAVLDFLVNKAMTKLFVWQKPEYIEEPEEEAQVDEDADVGGIEDEIDAVPEDDEAIFQESDFYRVPADEEEPANREILTSGIDPVAWQTELERVGHRLRIPNVAAGKEWRSHVEQTKIHEEKIRNIFSNDQDGPPPLLKQVQNLSEKISDAKEKINLKENYINKQFEDKKQSYQQLKTELTDLETKLQTSTDRVSTLTTDLGKLTEQLEDTKGTMTDRGNSMTDTSPLVHIKQSLKQLKQETIQFDLQIGVIGHRLMQQKLRHGNLRNAESKGFKMRGKISDDDAKASSSGGGGLIETFTAGLDDDDDDDVSIG